MDEAALDKLISDIQDFLRDSDEAPTTPQVTPVATQAPRLTPTPSRSIVRGARAARLLEVCAYAWAAFMAAVVLYLMWVEPPSTPSNIAQLVVLCTLGLFTTLALIGGAHRLATLLRIERNTREILRLRRRQNTILSRLVDRG